MNSKYFVKKQKSFDFLPTKRVFFSGLYIEGLLCPLRKSKNKMHIDNFIDHDGTLIISGARATYAKTFLLICYAIIYATDTLV